MLRLERLQAILTTLQSKRVVTAEMLAKKFEVSLRTIYRDIRSLEEGGIPIGAEAGIGYYIAEGYHLPPIMFTKEEARALLLAGKMMEKLSDKKINAIYFNALTKIQAVLDKNKKEELEDLESKILILPYSNSSTYRSEDILDKVKEALIANLNVSFLYKSESIPEPTLRKVDPLGICYYGNNWHLIGFCHLRKDYRDFRIDKIDKFKINNERFKPSSYLTINQYFERLIQTTELIKVVIKVEQKLARYISNSKYNMGFIEERKLGEQIEMEFAAYCLNHFAKWLLSLGEDVEILEPNSLKDDIKTLIINLHRKYINN